MRLLEQSILTGVNAELNAGDVRFSTKWSPDMGLFQSQARPFIAEVTSGPKAGQTYPPLSSLNEETRLVGADQYSFYTHMNSDSSFHSKTLDAPIRVYEDGVSLATLIIVLLSL